MEYQENKKVLHFYTWLIEITIKYEKINFGKIGKVKIIEGQ